MKLRLAVAVASVALAASMPVIAGSMSDSAKALASTKIELNVTNLTSAEDKFGVNPTGVQKTSLMAIGHDKLDDRIGHMSTYTLTKLASGKHGLGGNRDAEGSYSGHLLAATSRSGHTSLAIGTA